MPHCCAGPLLGTQGQALCFPAGLAFNADDTMSPNGINLIPSCVLLGPPAPLGEWAACWQPCQTQCPRHLGARRVLGPDAGGAGRRLLQGTNDTSVNEADISGLLPVVPAASSAFDASANTTTATYFIPLSLFSLNCNRALSAATTASQWSLGPVITDERVLAVISTVEGGQAC